MNEASAREQVRAMTDEAGFGRLERLVDLVIAENARQNLISAGSVAAIWSRHVLDSLQLAAFGYTDGDWIDIGTGGGFPGMAIATIRDHPMVLVEPRRRRAEFLRHASAELSLSHVAVEPTRIEAVQRVAKTISARAVASVENILQAAVHCATPETRWVLPRGRVTASDVAGWRRRFGEKVFHVEQSASDPLSSIVIVSTRTGR